MAQVKLRCLNPTNYQLTEGKVYIALHGIEKDDSNDTSWGWRWPDYVTIVDDRGHTARAHASRFVIVE